MSSNELRHFPVQSPGFQLVAPHRLPIYVFEGDDYAIFYAPRTAYVLPRNRATDTRKSIEDIAADGAGKTESASSSTIVARAALRIVRAARDAGDEAAGLASAVFSPECLTLFLSNACNLKCGYCHAVPGAEPVHPVTDDAVRAAARLVAAVCGRRRRVFTVAFHGGGEPSLDPSQVNRILGIVREEAQRYGVQLRTYIATNGVMSADRASWLAGHFDLIGLSCDGPPDIQDCQRPARDGSPTSSSVNRTATILRRAGKPFHIRATLTKETIARQAEITTYFLDQYAPSEVRIEPVYVNPAGATGLCADDAPVFVAGFMDARNVAAGRRVQVTTSMTRPASLYGRHCNMLRQVLNLAPGDIATGCFLESRESNILRRQVRVGAMNPTSACFDLEDDHLASLLHRCSAIPSCCRDCLCRLQCTHGCPDVCELEPPTDLAREDDITTGFRCQAHRLLMETLIREAADVAWRSTPTGTNQDVFVPGAMLRVAVYRGEDAGSAVS